MPSYHVENFGCRATQADGAAIDRQFAQSGLDRATSVEADLVILNTCTVTAAADQDARAAIRRVQRQNPNAKIVVTGCYAQRTPNELSGLSGVAAVIGNSHKHQLADLALQLFTHTDDQEGHGRNFVPLATLSQEPETQHPGARGRLFVSNIFAHTELMGAPVFESISPSHGDQRTRPNLKVQDGCDNRCSFCVIPYVRGQSRSLRLDEVLREVNALVAAGYREVVISGINLGRWGRDLQQVSESDAERPKFGKTRTGRSKPIFEDLVRAIISDTALEKLRISSVEPMDWSDELIRLVADSPRIAKHAHVPMQSGSDAVLRRMHRKYRPWHYREKIEKIRAAMTEAAIGADVMVGFPGETDAEFENTRRLIEDLPFTYLHVFTYSSRPGTAAASMVDHVPVHVARERNRILRGLAEAKHRDFMRSFVGKTIATITLGQNSEEAVERESPLGADAAPPFTNGLSDNYLKVRIEGHQVPNRWLAVQIDGVTEGSLMGQVRAQFS